MENLYFRDNDIEHAFDIFQNLIVPEPGDAVAAGIEIRCARLVLRLALRRSVLTAINFNNQLDGRDAKIHNIGTNSVLAPK